MKKKQLLVSSLVVLLGLQILISLLATKVWAESPPQIIWQVTFDEFEVRAIAVDSNDNIIVTGYEYIAKYDSAGNELWTIEYPGPGYADFRGVGVDSNNNIIVAGEDGSPDDDVLIVKYTPNGTMLWARMYDFDNWNDEANAVAVDLNDNIIVAGESDQREPPWEERWIVLKCDSNGNELERDIYSFTYNHDEANDVAVDSNNNIIVTGWSRVCGGFYPDDQMLTIKYDSNFNRIWFRKYGTVDTCYGVGNYANTVTVDSGDNIIIAGYSEELDKEVIKYSPSGNIIWEKDYPDMYSSAITSENGIIVASLNEIYKLTPDGNQIWKLDYIAGYEIIGIAIDSVGNLIVGGHNSSLEGIIVKYGILDRPVCYTNYNFKATGPFYNYDMFVRWNKVPASGSIYPAFCFGFQVGQGGYIGTQLVGSSKKAIFSIWDITEGSETAQPAHTNCGRFGGEGTGAKCIIDYPWQEGREYRLRVWEAGTDDTGEFWVGTIYDTVTQEETVIGLIHLENTGGYTGYGWLTNKCSTFLEYFGGPETCFGQPYSEVTWRGPYANHGNFLANSAIVSYNPCPTTNVTSEGRPLVTHEAGDDVQQTTPAGKELWDQETPIAPDLIVQNLNTNPAQPKAGEIVNITVTIKNQGNGSTRGATFKIDFYKNLSSSPEPGQPGDLTWSVTDDLIPGATKTLTGTIVYDSPGDYQMYAQVDGNQVIYESNESNNIFGPQMIHIGVKPMSWLHLLLGE